MPCSFALIALWMLSPVASSVPGKPLHFPLKGRLLVLDGHQHLVAHLGKSLHEVLAQVLEHMEAVE